MRRVLTVIFLAIAAAGCLRQPLPHIGDWDAKSYLTGDFPLAYGTFYFSKNGEIQVRWENFPAAPEIWEGDYSIDYSKNPIQLDIKWRTKGLDDFHGIVRFVGEGKNEMQYLYRLAKSDPRPTSFYKPDRFYWLMKKEK